MASKTQQKNLADKINALIVTKPLQIYSDEEPEDTKAKVVERYDENEISDDEFVHSKIRVQNVNTLDEVDERYAGKKVSRKSMYHNDHDNIDETMESEDSEENTEDDEMESTLEQSENDLDSNEDLDSQSEDNESVSDSEEYDNYDIDISNASCRKKETAIKTISETNVKAEVEKGNGVLNQLKVWENLLETRIKLQKCVVIGNQLPQYDTHKEFKSNPDFTKKINEAKTKLTLALNNMLLLRELLLKQYPETKNLSTKSKKRKHNENEDTDIKNPMDEEIPSDTEDELQNEENSSDECAEASDKPVSQKRIKYKDYEKVLQENHMSYTEYKNNVIKKWNDKTRIATGSLNKSTGQTTLKQIEFSMNDMNKLRKRTQLKRSEYNIVGKSTSTEDDGRRVQEYDSEIYDDDDFYHQLLRDLIEYKSSNVTDPIQLSKQWIQLQNMRRKMKRKIDTRATKGRKVRYNVHQKLVNFMAPITIYDTWTDTAKNELYNSLFGKIKPAEQQTMQ